MRCKGPLAGYPVVGLSTLLDGSYHPVDSSEMAFKMATILAFKQELYGCKPSAAGPIASLKLLLTAASGDIMGDKPGKRPCIEYGI